MGSEKRREQGPESYVDRSYRSRERSGLVSTFVKMSETDLHILAPVDVEEKALVAVSRVRGHIEQYIRRHPDFAGSLIPLPFDRQAPAVVGKMLRAGLDTGVGPMAAVAGAIAEEVGLSLIGSGIRDLIVENGGDLFLSRTREAIVSVFAGRSPLSEKIGIRLAAEQMPCGLCCSSGTIGHSLSLGQADAVVVMAGSTPLADAAATRIGNEVKKSVAGSLKQALEKSKSFVGVDGVLIIMGKQLGAWGNLELVEL